LALESHQAFQQDGGMQRAVSRKLLRQVPTCSYAGALDDFLFQQQLAKWFTSRQ
jgi:hypothetical protein